MDKNKNFKINLNKTFSDKEVEEQLRHVLFVDDQSLGKEIAKENKEKQDKDIHLKLLEDIAESHKLNHEQKRKLKPIFFWIVMTMYIVVILGSIATMVLIPIFCKEWYAIVPSVLASIASIVTALLKIPSIIAYYLFPTAEDNILLTLSSNVFRHDEKLKNKQDKQDK